MATINEIAKMAEVSRSTVSRVLNDSGYVSTEARERVEKVISDTGYRPSEHAKSLRTKKTKVIGVIVPTIRTETTSRLVAGMDNELSAIGYQILLANTNLDKLKEIEYVQLLKVRQVDGIILVATNVNKELVKQLKKLEVPIVVIGQEIDGFSNILYNDYQAARDITEYLIEKGHKRISFIGVDESDRAVGYLRKKAFLNVMEEQDLPIEQTWISKGIFNIHSGYLSMEQILTTSKQLPTALFAVTDRLALGAMQYLKEKGYRVPEDMAIIGIGASEVSEHVTPPLTTMDYQNEVAGQEAAKLMLDQLSKKEHVCKKKLLSYRLLKRGSV